MISATYLIVSNIPNTNLQASNQQLSELACTSMHKRRRRWKEIQPKRKHQDKQHWCGRYRTLHLPRKYCQYIKGHRMRTSKQGKGRPSTLLPCWNQCGEADHWEQAPRSEYSTPMRSRYCYTDLNPGEKHPHPRNRSRYLSTSAWGTSWG